MATEEFDLLGGTERELARRREMDKQAETQGGILGAQAFQDFVIPSKDPIGVKLLRKMGWKPGQGVGARISAAKRRKIAMANSESESDEDYDGDITFAPRDSAIIVFTQKRDTFGLGFDPYKNVPDIAAIKRSRTDRATAQGSGQDPSYNKVGFGVGVLDDDDDDDVYDSVSSARYATELYDDFDNDDRITIGGRQKTSKDSSKSRHRDNRQSTKRTGHDGRLPISGFEHGKSDVLQEKWYVGYITLSQLNIFCHSLNIVWLTQCLGLPHRKCQLVSSLFMYSTNQVQRLRKRSKEKKMADLIYLLKSAVIYLGKNQLLSDLYSIMFPPNPKTNWITCCLVLRGLCLISIRVA